MLTLTWFPNDSCSDVGYITISSILVAQGTSVLSFIIYNDITNI